MLKIAFDPTFALPLPNGHRFPMAKYELLPKQLLYEGTAAEENFFSPPKMNLYWIERTHELSYWNALKTLTLSEKEVRRIGFPLTAELIKRELLIASGTIQCTHYALQFGIAMNIAGGTHHAFQDRGEGYCLLNDQAIAATYLLENHLVKKILIIDLDVHQGNGTAKIFQNNPQVFTFSMHGASNFPYHKEKSDLDIPLADKTNDASYLSILKTHLPKLIQHVSPDFIFYLSGVDVLETDKLGKLSLTRQGCLERDYTVLSLCKNHKIPVVISMGGGYSTRLIDILEAHANTYRVAQELFF